MKRRGFLKIFGKVAAAVTAAPVLAKIPEKIYPWPESKIFNAMEYNEEPPLDVEELGMRRKTVITTGKYQKPLWPGLEKYYFKSDPASALARSMRETKERVAGDETWNVYNQAFAAGRRAGKSNLTREMIENGPHEVFGLAANYEHDFKDLFK